MYIHEGVRQSSRRRYEADRRSSNEQYEKPLRDYEGVDRKRQATLDIVNVRRESVENVSLEEADRNKI